MNVLSLMGCDWMYLVWRWISFKKKREYFNEECWKQCVKSIWQEKKKQREAGWVIKFFFLLLFPMRYIDCFWANLTRRKRDLFHFLLERIAFEKTESNKQIKTTKLTLGDDLVCWKQTFVDIDDQNEWDLLVVLVCVHFPTMKRMDYS